MDEEARVRTEKTGRIGHEAVTEATYVFDRSGAQSPTDTAFLFCQAFFFVPFASKKKAPNKSRFQYFVGRTVETPVPTGLCDASLQPLTVLRLLPRGRGTAGRWWKEYSVQKQIR